MMTLMYPKDGLSFEEFDRYWLENHGKVFSSLDIVRKNLLKYEQVRPSQFIPLVTNDDHSYQFHLNPQMNQLFAAQGLEPVSFVGVAIFEAESFDKIQEVFQHPDYIRFVVQDELKFVKREKCQMVAGELATVVHHS